MPLAFFGGCRAHDMRDAEQYVGAQRMKLRYFIPLLLLSACVLMLLNTALLGITASWSFHFMKDEYGRGNLAITRSFAVASAIAIGILAVPLGAFLRRPSSLWGAVLAVLGLTLVINPWNDDALAMLRFGIPEYTAYILSCWSFWKLGQTIRKRTERPQQENA